MAADARPVGPHRGAGRRLPLHSSEAHRLADMVVEVIAGCRRSVARKAAAGMPAFVRMQREGILDALDNQRRAAERSRSLIEDAALMGV